MSMKKIKQIWRMKKMNSNKNYQINDVVIGIQKSKYAPDNVVTGFIYKFVDNGTWAEIMDDEGNIKLVEVENIRERLATSQQVESNETIAVSSPSEQGSRYGHAADDEVAPLENAIDIRHTEDDADYIVRPGQEVQQEEYDPELDESLPVDADDEDDNEKLEKLNNYIPALEALLNDLYKEKEKLEEKLGADKSNGTEE